MQIKTLEGTYSCIVCDPPWWYNLRKNDVTHRNRITYESMTLEEIAALPIKDICDPAGTVLFLWTTNNHLPSAFKCLEAWDFELKTVLTWVKVTKSGSVHIGTGHWLRSATEHCLIATRGKVPAFAGRGMTNQSTVLQARRRQHSRKPDEFYTLVDELCPRDRFTKLDIFSRQTREGWDTWGDQATHFD